MARTALDVVTAPVKVVSGAVDLATTSQSETDEKRGRALRKREERLGRLDRRYNEAQRECEGGSEDACRDAQALYAELRELLAAAPGEP